MFSIQSLIDTPTDLEKLRETIRDSQIAFFLPVLNESIFAMFECDDIDSEFLDDLRLMFNELFEEEYRGYRQVDIANFTTFHQPEQVRIIDKLINGDRAVVDSPYLGYLSLELCLSALGKYSNNKTSSASTSEIIVLYGEASEAVALSRITSSYVELSENYLSSDEHEEYRLRTEQKEQIIRKQQAQKNNVKIKIRKEAKRRKRALVEIANLAKSIWLREGYIPVGAVAKAVYELISESKIPRSKFLLPSENNITEFLKATGTAPSTAIYNGRARFKYNEKRFRNQNYPVMAYQLAKENIAQFSILLKKE